MLHIHWTPTYRTPPWATHQRLTGLKARELVVTDCCYCNMPANQTACSLIVPLPPPLGMEGQEQMDWFMWASGAGFYEAIQHIECGPGYGCKKNPRRLIGKHLREWRRYGY